MKIYHIFLKNRFRSYAKETVLKFERFQTNIMWNIHFIDSSMWYWQRQQNSTCVVTWRFNAQYVRVWIVYFVVCLLKSTDFFRSHFAFPPCKAFLSYGWQNVSIANSTTMIIEGGASLIQSLQLLNVFFVRWHTVFRTSIARMSTICFSSDSRPGMFTSTSFARKFLPNFRFDVLLRFISILISLVYRIFSFRGSPHEQKHNWMITGRCKRFLNWIEIWNQSFVPIVSK